MHRDLVYGSYIKYMRCILYNIMKKYLTQILFESSYLKDYSPHAALLASIKAVEYLLRENSALCVFLNPISILRLLLIPTNLKPKYKL